MTSADDLAPSGRPAPLLALLAGTVLLVPLSRPMLGLPVGTRVWAGVLCVLAFAWLLRSEPPGRQRRYLAMAAALAIVVVAPVSTSLEPPAMAALGVSFAAALIVPALLLRGAGVITYSFWPRRPDLLDVLYTIASVPLAWGAISLYFGFLSPEVPENWSLPDEPDGSALLKLFLGINAVGVWDELFFINTVFAIARSLFPYRWANPAQAVVYVTVLYEMAFTGWGPLLVAVLALVQGAMYERSRVLVWVLIVHLVVDYFLFQGIVEYHYPGLQVWWH